MDESKNAAKEGVKIECKVTADDFRKYEKMKVSEDERRGKKDEVRKSAFLDKMYKKLRETTNEPQPKSNDYDDQ